MKAVNTNAVLILLAIVLPTNTMKTKRSIDLSASHPLISDIRLPTHIVPKGYTVIIRPNIESSSFAGTVKINMSWTVPTRQISLHAHYDLQINEKSLRLSKETVESGQEESNFQDIPVLRGDRLPKKTVYVVYLRETVQECSHCVLSMDFEGGIWKTQEGLFKASFTDIMGYERTYLVTNMKPNNARRLFPCFDEPGFKVPFEVSIARPKDFVTLFNTQLLWTEMQDVENSASDYVIDHFEITPPMSTFTFGFVTAQLEKLDIHSNISSDFEPFEINMWGSRNMVPNLDDVYTKLTMIYKLLVEYFNSPLPLKKIDVLALPGLPLMYPSDNWGLLIFKETELFNYGYYHLAQELIYQWLGSWITPEWWNDLHVNKALTSFLAANIAFQIDDGHEFNEKYPMTILYSLYYEFSKRYPHSRITGMKHETTSYKTELVIRMLNYTLGHRSFQAGLRKFVAKKIFTTYTADDLWNALTEQAIIDSVLPSQNNIANIANSWISKDRLPVINVERNYIDHLATITQKVYLRERPHDVPDRDKMLWWIPLVVIEEGNLNFSNTRPRAWMPNVTKYILHNVDENEKFIIVNPEEIGPFPVNYDAKNWNRLSTFLQTESGLQAIPAYTRAKLLHDAWNLAYAGDLSFATAFNMTLFMKFECDHLVWNPVFTFIDHIGRHIDISDVHIKFEVIV
ncbi:aminopeptidase N [Haematobia irritans]|uniref:aminopeptidase N n=1 Tax=Haematobia irritans TaxID=7368 RepID=UPI003F506FE6